MTQHTTTQYTMTKPQKNTALVLAIVAGVVSLPLTWMTIHGATIQGGFGEIFESAFGGITLNVTGFNGQVTFLIKSPIWFIVGIAIAASVLQLMQGSKLFAIPHSAEWLTSIIAVVWISLAIVMGLFSGKATLGIGAILGLISALIPLACLVIPGSSEQEPNLNNSSQTTP